jgi:hypothetical protein
MAPVHAAAPEAPDMPSETGRAVAEAPAGDPATPWWDVLKFLRDGLKTGLDLSAAPAAGEDIAAAD